MVYLAPQLYLLTALTEIMVSVSDLYILIFDGALANKPELGHGTDGYYIGANGEYTLAKATKLIAQELHALGKSGTPEPTSYTDEELQKYTGVRVRLLICA
jgi:hypothetical protein